MSDLIDKLKQYDADLPRHTTSGEVWKASEQYAQVRDCLPAIIARLESDAGEIARLKRIETAATDLMESFRIEDEFVKTGDRKASGWDPGDLPWCMEELVQALAATLKESK